jgi:hypothetical protein
MVAKCYLSIIHAMAIVLLGEMHLGDITLLNETKLINRPPHNSQSHSSLIRKEEKVAQRSDQHAQTMLQFAIVGFPKCSTTFLRNSLLSPSNQIFFGNNQNEIHLLRNNNVQAFKDLFQNYLNTTNGFKDPGLLYSHVGLYNLYTHYPNTDLIISVRHPVLWFQSFYNYHIREGYHLLIGNCPNTYSGILNIDDSPVKVGSHGVCTDL